MTEITNRFDINKLKSIAQEVLEIAKKFGADQAEVSIDANKGFSVSAHNSDVETVEYNQDKVIDITVDFGKRSGTTSITDMNPDALKAAVEAACHIAKYTDEDPASGLASKEELAFNYPDLKLATEWDISVDQAIELACQCEKEALAFDKRIMGVEDAGVSTVQTISLYANSFGFVGYYPASHHEIVCVLIAKSRDEMQREYSYSIASDPAKLKSAKQVAIEAAERTIGRLGAKSLKTKKVPVIFHAEEARTVLGHFSAALQGANLYRKWSFLEGQLGKKIFPDFIQVKEHPHLSGALGSAPFDDDGVLTRSNVFIENGILSNYALGVYSARKLNMKTTGNAGGVHNLSITTGDKDLKALLKSMGTGLLVTELMGQGINLITGDYSRGAGGFWVENGEIQFPVSELTVAGNLQDMYANIVEVGNDIDRRGNIHTGSIFISEMTVAGSG